MGYPRTGIPRSTNPYPWVNPIPFNPETPFGNGTLGLIMPGTATTPAANLHIHKVSSGNYRGNADQAAGAIEAMTNPTNLGTAHAFLDGNLEDADMLLIRPFLVLYGSSAHTAFAAAPARAAGSCRLDFWTIKPIGGAGVPERQKDQPVEYGGTYVGGVTVSNNGIAMTTGTRKLPTAAQFCDSATVNDDESISPGITVVGGINAGAAVPATKQLGALCLKFDQMGGQGLIVEASGITSTSWGVGFLRSHL
jgi:hypothetical protein